ncbi:PDZ and LIM domain protein 2 [Pholidichthys leucotaenia]
MALTVNLIGPSPWGFRILGGRELKKAITITKVTGGSKAEQADLHPGDIILEINGENAANMLNAEAQNKIRNSKNHLQLVVERSKSFNSGQTNGIGTPEQLTGQFKETLMVSRDENQNYREYTISSPASMSPGPYSPDFHASPDGKGDGETPTTNKGVQMHSWSPDEKCRRLSKSLSQEISPSDYRNNYAFNRTPTPTGRYSPHSPFDRDTPVSPRRSPSFDFTMQKYDKDSELYKMIMENRESHAPPRQSNRFKILQEALEADEQEAARMFPGRLSPNPPKPTQSVGKYHTCEKCGNKIVTQAVRITDERFRHPECYTCADCGLNLSMRGHFWSGDVMYCEKHAKERYQGPGSSPHAAVTQH